MNDEREWRDQIRLTKAPVLGLENKSAWVSVIR